LCDVKAQREPAWVGSVAQRTLIAAAAWTAKTRSRQQVTTANKQANVVGLDGPNFVLEQQKHVVFVCGDVFCAAAISCPRVGQQPNSIGAEIAAYCSDFDFR
jgi:hypothetical protein